MFIGVKQHPWQFIAYLLCLLFILSGAVNYGWSRWFLAIPFMICAIGLSTAFSKTLLIFTVIFSLGSIIVNSTLEKNPLMFPILMNGEVTFLEDGYIRIYDDNSGGFYKSDDKGSACTGCGRFHEVLVRKGQTTKVIRVIMGHADMGTTVNLMTELGPINSHNITGYGDGKRDITLNKSYKNEFLTNLSFLMMYPVLPVMIPVLFGKIL